MMEFLQGALTPGSPLEARARVGSESLRPLAEAIASCCEDSDPKVTKNRHDDNSRQSRQDKTRQDTFY